MKALTSISLCLALSMAVAAAAVVETDVCVFGGMSGGIAAAIQAARMGKSVALVEPGKYLGGLTTGGLGATDIGNKAAIGGLSREFYHRIAQHYAKDDAWKWETRADYFAKRGSGQSKASDLSSADATMWTFEPSMAERVYADMLREANVSAQLDQRLVSVRKNGRSIAEFTTEDGTIFRAKMFIDATYEGDLLAKAGVSYHVGRESNATYGETLNGIRANTPHHQFTVAVEPFVTPGDPSSGLLPFIQGTDPGWPGDGDRRVQAYNYRLCFTTNAALRLPATRPDGMPAEQFAGLQRVANGRLPVTPPADYDPAKYELLGRYIEALVVAGKSPRLAQFWNPIWMPNQKTDINNNGGFSTDFIGMSWAYPEAGYEQRAGMEKEHANYIRGFLTFLATDLRVPESMRREMQQWGPAKDEFTDTAGWPRQLYVREARRMISDYVMSEKHCRYQEVAPDSVGLAAYNMDSHNCQRVARNGRVENEGDVQVPPMKPYPISYRAIVPKAAECDNLLVPVCLAASHIAYGSIRMEPVFMILGQSAATAAALAIDDRVPVQKLDYAKLRARLLADRQILDWTNAPTARAAKAPVGKLEGIVCDDADAVRKGDWTESTSLAFRAGHGYVHDNNQNKGGCALIFTPLIATAGEYEVFLIWPPNPNRATRVPVTVQLAGGSTKLTHVNQRTGDGRFSLGRVTLPAGKPLTVTVSNRGTDGYVVVDALQVVRVK